MENLPVLVTHFEEIFGQPVPLPAVLAGLYGQLRFPPLESRPYLFANFVSTLDGVVSLNEPGHRNAGEISGFNPHDQMVMGLLRAVSDAVIAGASAVRSLPGHIWSAEFIYPPLSTAYQELRAGLGKSPHPLNVVVTAQGSIDLSLPLFRSGDVPVLVLTSPAGLERLRRQPTQSPVQIITIPGQHPFTARQILDAIATVWPALEWILLEGGPHLMGEFLSAGVVDELFLTLAPQVAGRDAPTDRPGLVAGHRFAPHDPRWGKLISLKQAGSHLFLRYSFR